MELKVKNFLCCLKLETGGYILGWLNFILSIIGVLVALGLFGFLAIVGCSDKKNDFCSSGLGIMIGILVFVLLILFFYMWVYYKLIKGTSERDHKRVMPAMIISIVVAAMAIIGIFTGRSEAIGSSIVSGCLQLYLAICLYSLYDMFKQESERGFTPQYQQGGKV